MRRSSVATLIARAVMCVTLFAALSLGPAGLGAVLATTDLCACKSADATQHDGGVRSPSEASTEAPRQGCKKNGCEAADRQDGCTDDCEHCGCCHALAAVLPDLLQVEGPASLVPREPPMALATLL